MIHNVAAGRSPDAILWLTGPRAAARFDATLLAAEDAARWRFVRTVRRRLDFQVSRALLQHAGDVNRRGALSHSRGLAALLTPITPAAQAAAWGVDVELHRPRRLQAICEAAFTVQETAFVLSDSTRMLERFHVFWTLKEAFAKAANAPLFEALVQCRIAPGERWRLHAPDPRPVCGMSLSFPDLTVSVVCLGARAPLEVELREWPDAQTSPFRMISVEGVDGAARLQLAAGALARAAAGAPPAAAP